VIARRWRKDGQQSTIPAGSRRRNFHPCRTRDLTPQSIASRYVWTDCAPIARWTAPAKAWAGAHSTRIESSPDSADQRRRPACSKFKFARSRSTALKGLLQLRGVLGRSAATDAMLSRDETGPVARALRRARATALAGENIGPLCQLRSRPRSEAADLVVA